MLIIAKWTFLFFIGLFELGSMITALATSSNMFIVGRAVAGMGASGLVNGALTIIAASVPLHKRAGTCPHAWKILDDGLILSLF